jgi:hypothetical protein
MMASATRSSVLVVADERFADSRTLPYAGRQALVPILLGLAIPAIAAAIFFPGLLSNKALVFGFFLMAIFVAATVIFIRSVFNPGSVVEATFNTSTRMASFVRLGTFATSTTNIPFDDVAKVYLESNYDDDGYKSFQPIIELKDGDIIELPEGTTQGQINSIRAMLGR